MTVLLGALLLAGIFVFLGEQWVMRVIERERQFNHGFYPKPTAEAIEYRASDWYQRAFVDTGVQSSTFAMFTRESGPGIAASPFDGTGMALYAWYEGRVRAFWAVIFQATLRLSQLVLWLPILVVCLFPWVVDGLMARKIRQHTYRHSSHLQHHYALLGISIILLLAMAMVIAPIPMPPVAIPVAILTIGVLVQRMLANYVKRA
jgi:hypothetical protein